jgi:hypothetical protein
MSEKELAGVCQYNPIPGRENENLQIGTASGFRTGVHDCGHGGRSAYFDFQVQDGPGAGSADYNGWRD